MDKLDSILNSCSSLSARMDALEAGRQDAEPNARKISEYRREVDAILSRKGMEPSSGSERAYGENIFVWGVKKGINAYTTAMTIINTRK